jgi:hypothetical protein
MKLLAAGSMANRESAELTTAVYLANNINEMMQGKPYATLHANYDNKTYNLPVDAGGNTLAGLSGWSQVVDVQYVLPTQLTLAVPDTQVEVTSRVTVNVKHGTETIYTAKWIVVAQN